MTSFPAEMLFQPIFRGTAFGRIQNADQSNVLIIRLPKQILSVKIISKDAEPQAKAAALIFLVLFLLIHIFVILIVRDILVCGTEHHTKDKVLVLSLHNVQISLPPHTRIVKQLIKIVQQMEPLVLA